jgi:hypothetical protein
MKTIVTTFFAFILTISIYAQQFNWAKSYDIYNSHSVASIDIDESGNIITVGVYEPSPTYTYYGKVYVQKTDAIGDSIWTFGLNGIISMGDMETVGDNILIIGQSYGQFTYRGTNYGQYPYCMFVIMLDSNGEVMWHFSEQDKWGQYTNIAVGNTGDIALHIRGEGNSTDWIYIVDTDGNILEQKHVNNDFTLVTDIAYYDGCVYFNGSFFGPGTTMVDTILVELPEFENASITMGFDENLTAKWLRTGQTINNSVGQIEADEHGLVVYEPLVDNFFNDNHTLTRFDFEGEILAETEIPAYSTFSVLRPDLTISPEYIGLFMRNSNTGSHHIALIYDKEFNLVSEKEVTGASSTWGGRITHSGDDFFIAHVQEGTINFNDEISLPYSGTGENIYVAKIGNLSTGIETLESKPENLLVFPNPATNFIMVDYANHTDEVFEISIYNQSGQLLQNMDAVVPGTEIDIRHLNPGIFVVRATMQNGKAVSGTFTKMLR